MRRTIILFLLVSLSTISCTSCKLEAKKVGKPLACQADERDLADCRESLAACVNEDAPPSVPAEAPTPEGEFFQVPPDEALVPGAVFNLARGFETEVVNPTPVNDGAWRFSAGSDCITVFRASITVIGRDGGDILVRYRRVASAEPSQPCTLSAEEKALPKECPDGTVFFIQDSDADALMPYDDPNERFEKARKILNSENP